jgi:hypothetical protein
MPASLPTRPWGGVRVRLLNCWEPSARVRFTTRGVFAAATGETVPASKVGLLGSWLASPAQLPFGPRSIAQESEGVAGGPESGADQGVSEEVVS